MTGLAALLLSLALGPHPALKPLDVPLPPLPMAAFPDHEPPGLNCRSWALYSVDEGSMLWTGDPDARRSPASVTKLMTALVVVERVADLNQEVVISEAAANTPVGYVGQAKVEQGEVWTVEELLADILVQSDNGAAVALAEHVAGSVDAFVDLMNQKALQLGMNATVFENPNGLDVEGHLSTARDLIRLGAAVIREPRLTHLTRVKYITFFPGSRTMEVRNTNRLLGTFPGVLGLKTGDTESAGLVLLSYLVGPHNDFLGVVMGSRDHMRDTRELMAYALRTLGPQDHFFSVAVDHEITQDWPEWLRARISAAGPLDVGAPARRLTPAEWRLVAGLRDLLPALLGGEAE